MIINIVCKSQFQRIYKTVGCLKSTKQFLEIRSDFNHAVAEAEKVVGYPTSSLNLRWLLTDELANVAFYLRKLIGTNHTLLQTAKTMFTGNLMPSWGLIVLLISKAYGLNSEFSETEKDVTIGVLHSQRALAEVTEMMRTSNIIHKSILNLDENEKDDLDLNFGNKITLLSGDYLIAKSLHQLACLRNQNVNELMWSALRDLVDSEFLGLRDEQNVPIPSKPVVQLKAVKVVDQFGTEPYKVDDVLGHPIAEWTLRNILGGGSLLGKSCQGVLKLAHQPEEIQELGYIFGKSIALAWQAKCEQEAFTVGSSGIFSLVSAPAMFHLQSDPSCYDELFKDKDIDYDNLRRIIKSGSALENTQKLKNEHLFNALKVLKTLSASDARTALENIMHSAMFEI